MSDTVTNTITDPVFHDGGPPLTRLQNMVRVAKGLALLFFFLPWVTVSCGTQTLASVSGMTMMTGRMALKNPVTGENEAHGGMNGFVLAAFAILVALLILGFVWKNRAALMTGLVGCLVAAGALIFGVAIKSHTVMAEAREKMNTEMGPSPEGVDGKFAEMGRNMANSISINLELGFWLTVIALLAAAWLYWLMARGKGNFDNRKAG